VVVVVMHVRRSTHVYVVRTCMNIVVDDEILLYKV
jgi:hypothetical protein